MTKRFIDISEHNTLLDIDKIPQSNLSGVIIKATEGTTYQDHAMEILYDALNGKISIGFYHFLSATSEPKTQALNFWNQIKDKEYQIIPCLDVERNEKAPLEHLSESYAIEFIQEFRDISGQDIMIYSNRCYIEEYFSLAFRQAHTWWVADYSANTTPEVLGCKILGWQYTEHGKYDFNLGDLDVNILVDEDSFFIKELEIPFSDDSVVNDYDSIKELQHELNEQNFTDCYWNELVEDGIVGDLTISACPTMHKGAEGKITKWVQTKLGIKADGIFGEQTFNTVKEFQRNNFLKVDGIVGTKTWRKLLGV